MKTILVDAINGLIFPGGTVYEAMHQLLETYPNPKLVVTNANDEQWKQHKLDNSPYEVFTCKHNPEKTNPAYFTVLFTRYGLSPKQVVYFEHSQEAVKTATSLGIPTYYYDESVQDLGALKAFLDSTL